MSSSRVGILSVTTLMFTSWMFQRAISDPYFTTHPTDTLAVEGFPAQMNCTGENVTVSTDWFRTNTERANQLSQGNIPYKTYITVVGNHDLGEYSLRFMNPALDQEDVYICLLSSGPIFSTANATLYILAEGPTCSVNPRKVVIENSNATFTCTVSKGVPPGESVWTINGVEESRQQTTTHAITKTFTRHDNGTVFNCGISHETLSPQQEDQLMCDESIVMEVQFPAIVNITRETENTVVEGDTYFAECEVQENGNPQEIDRWYWYYPNGMKHNNLTLYLTDVSRDDNGTYTCVAENTYYNNMTGYGNATVDLNVHYEPEALIYDLSNGKVIEGGNYKATCVADANPAATFSWTGPDGSLLSNNSQLEINDIQKEDAGIYTCHANNTFFNGKEGYGSKSIEIDVQYKADVSAVIHGDASIDGEIIEGDSMSIECVVIDANPAEDTVSWTKDNGVTMDNWMNLTDISRLQHGIYTCVANNTFWNNSTGTGITDQRVDVQYSPEIDEFEDVTHAIEGRMFQEVCIAMGNPMPDVQWKYNDSQVSQTATLQYKDIQRHQRGDYICEANNTFWNGERGAAVQTLQLDVQYPPTIDVASRHVRKKHESVTFKCNVIDANPMNTVYTWLFSDEIFIQGPELRLYNVTRDMTGDYECIGNNTYYNGEQGTGRNTTYFDVQYGPEVKVEFSDMRVKEGTQLPLVCSVESNPPVDYHNWTKDGITVSSELTYTVEMVNRNDTGIYNCTAETTFYNDDVDTGYDMTHVVVEYLPIVDILGPPVAVVEDINKTLITCTVTDGIPDPQSITLFHVNETVNQVDSTENQNGVTSHTFDLGVTQRWHSGSYYCEANTTFVDKSTESGISEEIPVIVHYKPSIAGEDEETIEVTKGSSASLICTVDAYPDAEITWTKDGESLDAGKDTGTYDIASVTGEDEDEYVCNAKNYLGQDTRTINLKIIVSQGQTDIPLIAGISAGILLLLIVIIVLAVMIKRQKKPDKKKNEASEMSPLHFQQTPQAFEIHENPDVANNDTGDTGEKRKSNMYTDAPMSTFKTESDQNNVGGGGQGGGSDDLDDITVLYAQPTRKSLHQSADSGNKNHVPFDAEPGEYDPPQEPPRFYKVDNNVEGLTYADLDHAPGSGVTAPRKQPEGTTDYATLDFNRTAPQ